MDDIRQQERYFIDKINELKDEFDYWECRFKKEHQKINYRDVTPEERAEMCKNCLLNLANIDIYDIEGNAVTVNLCTLLDVMDNIYY